MNLQNTHTRPPENNSYPRRTFAKICAAVEEETLPAVAAVRSQQVGADVIAAHVACLTLVHVCGDGEKSHNSTIKKKQTNQEIKMTGNAVPSQRVPSSLR